MSSRDRPDPAPDHEFAEPRLPHPEESEYCGPDQLCRMILMLRRWEKTPDLEGEVTEPGLRRLLDLAFQVSLTTEEGRHPRFRIYVPCRQPQAASPRPVIRFEPKMALTDQLLRRIAPSVSSRMHALQVVEANRKLYGDAIIGIAGSSASASTGSLDVSTGLGIPGLMVRVDGPGILRVTEKGTWELRAGRIQPVHHYAILKVVRDWFQELAQTFMEKTSAVSTAVAKPDGDPAAIFDATWSFILSTAISAHHGGAFVVLPSTLRTPAPVHVTYSAERLDLMRGAVRFFEACYDADKISDPREAQKRAHDWEAARARMFSAARGLADLANVDGCVVLDRGLRLTGFGGEIRAHENDIAGARCIAAHPQTLEEQEPIEIERFGTRHRSAMRLCAAVPGTLAFVISQDGDLRVFYGLPDRRVCMWRNLGAWMSASERW